MDEGNEKGRGRRRRRSYPPEYKADVVAMCVTGERTINAIAHDLGIATKTVHRWVVEAEQDPAEAKADRLSAAEREELAQLRKEVRVLREERDILKRATAFFAKETR